MENDTIENNEMERVMNEVARIHGYINPVVLFDALTLDETPKHIKVL